MKKLLFVFVLLALIVPSLSFAAYNWAETRPIGDTTAFWSATDIDSDGSSLIVGNVNPGGLFTSDDGGDTWTERNPGGVGTVGWYAVASDADGSNLIAAPYPGRVYISTDSGANWTETQPRGNASGAWVDVDSDADGSNLIIADGNGSGNGRIYTSSNGGANWTERQPAGNTVKYWTSVASDADGSNLIVAATFGRLYTSSNGGANWTERQPAGNTDHFWSSVASDADGSTLMAGTYLNGLPSHLYISTDGGANWTERDPVGGADGNWAGFSMSDDGSVMLAENSYDHLYVSRDGGGTWSQENVPGNQAWGPGAMDADGSTLVAGAGADRLYLGEFIPPDTTPPVVVTRSPADNDADVAVSTDELIVTFDEDIVATLDTNCAIRLFDETDLSTYVFFGDSDQIAVGDTSATTTLLGPLLPGHDYHVEMDGCLFEDLAGNPADDITDATTWNFTTEDATAPVITILGSNPAEVLRKNTYTDAGATALDDVDGDLTEDIVTTGSVNTQTVGTYHIVYSVTDAADNTAYATRTVEVISRNEDDDDDNGNSGGHHHGDGNTGVEHALAQVLQTPAAETEAEAVTRLTHLVDVLKQILAVLMGQSKTLPH